MLVMHIRIFQRFAKIPKIQSPEKRSMPTFYQDNVKIQFSDTHVKIEGFALPTGKNKQKINWIRLAGKGRIPTIVNIVIRVYPLMDQLVDQCM